MFLGEFKRNVDDKGRLTIPAKFADELAAGLVVTYGFDRNLAIYSMSAWNELAERITSLPVSDRRTRSFRHRFFSGAANLKPDRQGRILLPANLREFAQIDTEVVIIGNFDVLEIWSAANWDTQREKVLHPDDDEMWDDLGF